MRQYSAVRRCGGAGFAAIGCLVVIAGCQAPLRGPTAPSGKGWTTYAQGFHELEYHDVSMTTMHPLSGKMSTVTSRVRTSMLSNVSSGVKVQAEDVRQTLEVGRNVAELKFNEPLAKDIAR